VGPNAMPCRAMPPHGSPVSPHPPCLETPSLSSSLQVNSQALKAVLDRLFLSTTLVLSSVWEGARQQPGAARQGEGPAGGTLQQGAHKSGEHGASPVPLPAQQSAPAQRGLQGQRGAAGPGSGPHLRGAGGAAGAATAGATTAAAAAAAAAAQLVGVFADLQFCRLALPAYAAVLKVRFWVYLGSGRADMLKLGGTGLVASHWPGLT
jgi:hypothetical protein